MTAPKAFEIHLSNFDWSLRSLTALDPYGSELIEDDVSLAGTFIMPLSSGRTKGLAVKGGRVNASSTAETTASYTASRFILAVLLESDHLPFRRRLVSLQQATSKQQHQGPERQCAEHSDQRNSSFGESSTSHGVRIAKFSNNQAPCLLPL